jgi:hypothetical protein
MNPPAPPRAYQMPPQPQGIVSPVYDWPARSKPLRGHRSRRGRFWAFAACHAFVLLLLAGAGASQTYDTTFAVVGAGAAVDVMIAAGAWVWQQTGRRQI